ncbi:MAG: transcription elongation factor GreA [Candidatus Phytoplasma stylosanthis]|uniref:transcription elongation factor GreA n=1 Tax=Candidatus Phytoplasma stylosanthis TaxID=2798314 RepID=UPI00293A0F06|nr:transcription elongation factor GreA [Candidatus Phytoplasma stylosanthis]MDV3167946.1 transcription elongation factor GreA [Candidatus Phytoplasma stylosanthis]MDV3171039.1 transcription elongation factor GreA [Candidatus Phytoplasma stylosanthis]MDV3173627.1 transcription elongation factor GreA [Candidatus Phytoplasma stylosanthis]MDV3174239.1 transcription elongation factor GreA [Candidatus Phytoplasma stylosanthis]MDV3202704.1 transcription elongation factor GreA [Candidatus Phytoplasma
MNKKNYELTQSGLDKLKEELEYLKNVKRNENLKAIQEAREQGDLSENADYSAARDEQAFIELRILEIQNILKNVKIIDTFSKNKEINIGKKVLIQFLHNMKEEYIQLVGVLEVNPFINKISIESPIGQSLKGYTKNDQVSFKSETGKIFKIKILKVE